MSLPLWDPISLPPGMTLVDINGIEDDSLRLELQGEALQAWMDDEGTAFEPDRAWSDGEGMFAVMDSGDNILGVALLLDGADA